jgi:excisionase family DNA binding protein
MQILTIDQVAESLQMSGEQVRQLIKSGELPGFSIGIGKRKHYRIEAADVAAFVKRRKQAEKQVDPRLVRGGRLEAAGGSW